MYLTLCFVLVLLLLILYLLIFYFICLVLKSVKYILHQNVHFLPLFACLKFDKVDCFIPLKKLQITQVVLK
jgi:hypothetical protein